MLSNVEWDKKNIETQKSIAWGQAWNLAMSALKKKNYDTSFNSEITNNLDQVNKLAIIIYPYLRKGAPDKEEGEFMDWTEFIEHFTDIVEGNIIWTDDYDETKFNPYMRTLLQKLNRGIARDADNGDMRFKKNLNKEDETNQQHLEDIGKE